MTDEEKVDHSTRNVPAREIDAMLDNALWCATANAQDGCLFRGGRSFTDSLEGAIGWTWPLLLASWDTPDQRIRRTTDQEGIDAYVG